MDVLYSLMWEGALGFDLMQPINSGAALHYSEAAALARKAF
jgi:hypothetical protein